MLAGDVSTGKTSFLTQLIYQTADRNPKPNQSLTFFTMKLSKPQANLQIWDSPGDPRFHYQVISNLLSFQALLVFVDVTNSHTLDCARTLISGSCCCDVELRCYPTLQVHIVESKDELTLKDPIKRKVSRLELEQLAAEVGGHLFQYTRTDSV